MRKGRGVYYTPPPVVNFIVRAVDDILKESFGIRDGLADHNRVTVLDFACGTGTFLLEVFERIFDNIGGADSGRAGPIVREHITKNVFGFEYLIAPYTIAHLKLSQYLKDKGHPLQGTERLQVFLTNTLDPGEPQENAFMPSLSAESKAAHNVKEKPILVIVGNPPYSGHSKNKGKWIKGLIDGYTPEAEGRATAQFVPGYKHTIERQVTGRDAEGQDVWADVPVPLGERNPKWLNDDYVKFIRFAQWKMDQAPEGVVGIITNHSWLDNPTFRAMRQSLMRSFDQIHVLDLHGNAKKKERAPDGGKDENVFDIEQGVAISLFVKKPGLEKGVWRGDLWGTRLAKYEAAARSTLADVSAPLHPVAPVYLFTVQNRDLRTEWDGGWRLPEVMHLNVLGFQTHRDNFALSFSTGEMRRKFQELADPMVADADLTRKYGVKTSGDWSLPDTRDAVRAGLTPPVTLLSYRPFDDRWGELSSLTMDRPRRELILNVAGRDNVSLLVPRQIGTPVWRHVAASTLPAESCFVSSDTKSQNYVFPLWLFQSGTPKENLSPDFRTYLDARFDHHYTPEEVLGYIYAVLHAPAYRSRYAEFLRIDFPRIPFPETREHFDALSGLGWALVQVHLLKEKPAHRLAAYPDRGANEVEKPRYSPEEHAIWINGDPKTGRGQRFAPVPQAVWDFHIGGYQVLDKYLKSRKGRTLSLDEINHVADIAGALSFTIDQMALIDAAYRAAFPDRG